MYSKELAFSLETGGIEEKRGPDLPPTQNSPHPLLLKLTAPYDYYVNGKQSCSIHNTFYKGYVSLQDK